MLVNGPGASPEVRNDSPMPEQKKIEVKKPGFKDIVSSPCSYCTVIMYVLCGLTGGIFAIIAFTNNNVGWYSPAMLVAVAVYATYEIRLLASLKKELNGLNEVQASLREQVGRLDKQVQQFDKTNDKFKREKDQLALANDSFKDEINELEQTTTELSQAKDQFEYNNGELEKQMNRLGDANSSMQGNLQRLTEQTDELEYEYKQFQEIQTSIQKYATQNGLEMSSALERQHEMFEKLERVMKDNAFTLLQQIATDMEFRDSNEGMTEKEYNGWIKRLPSRFKETLKEKEITFTQFAGPDGVMDYEEMTTLIDSLLDLKK